MTAQGAVSGTPVDPILAQLSPRLSGARLRDAQTVTGLFLCRIPADELSLRAASDWAALAERELDFMRERGAGAAKARVVNPDQDGAQAGRTIVEVVTDDMPFLVDSVSMAIANAGLQIHLVIHPVFRVERDAKGVLQSLGAVGSGPGGAESLMYFEVERIAAGAAMERLQRAIVDALDDVRASVADWQPMRERMLSLANDLAHQPLPIDADGVAEAQDFLRWVADENFTFLGYREYEVVKAGNDEVLQAVEGSGLGILRGSERSLSPRSLRSLVATGLPQSGSMDAIILTKTNARANVHRPGYMDYIGVLGFDKAGVPVVEQRFLGLFTTNAYMARPQDVPLVRRKVEAVMQRSGLRRDSHSGKALRHVLELLPRDELFQCSEDELFAIATGILALRERPRPRLFVRRDKYGRFYSCLVYLPRDRFSTEVRTRIEASLRQALHGERIDSSIQVGESPLAHLHLVVRPRPGDRADYDVAALESELVAIVRNWHDELRDRLIREHGEPKGIALASEARALPAGYVEEVSPVVAAADVQALAALGAGEDIRLSLYQDPLDGALRFKVIHFGAPIPLSEALPMLENIGVRVLAEHVYTLEKQGRELTIHDFELKPKSALAFELAQLRERFERGFEALWRGQVENDGFNNLILAARLGWRQVSVLRGYCKYLLQTGVTFSQTYMEDTLNRYPAIAGLLIELFEAGFDPQRESAGKATIETAGAGLGDELRTLVPGAVLKAHPHLVDDLVVARAGPRTRQIEAIIAAIKILLENVASLDEDRILRAYLGVIGATLRTNYFQSPGGKAKDYVSFKFDSSKVPDLPKPRPYREIWVYSPRVEGVHLRFGPVARGGLRWSDRREDFRTEVLGLVKAQMVKNTVIVPVGSKGGFFVKH
ncbi:MAG: NAD-glutamate dehydrogenase domain-containing protein, partial [Lysobacterales bacterium]